MNAYSSYFNDISNQRILIVGPLPPPYGGVAVHIERAAHILEKQGNTVTIADVSTIQTRTGRWNYLLHIICNTTPHIVMNHTLYNSVIEWIILFLGKYFFRYQLIVIEHDCRHLYRHQPIKRWILSKTISRINTLVVIGEITLKSFIENNIALPEKCSIETPYLPAKESESVTVYPESMHDFIQNRTPLLLACAYSYQLIDQQDVYGFNMMIDLIQELKKEYPSVGLLITIGTRGTGEYRKYIFETIAHRNLTEHFYFLEESYPLCPLFKSAHIFIRPNCVDSYGISVAEAIAYGIPAIASDICERPQGTLLFKHGALFPFLSLVQETLAKQVLASRAKKDLDTQAP